MNYQLEYCQKRLNDTRFNCFAALVLAAASVANAFRSAETKAGQIAWLAAACLLAYAVVANWRAIRKLAIERDKAAGIWLNDEGSVVPKLYWFPFQLLAPAEARSVIVAKPVRAGGKRWTFEALYFDGSRAAWWCPEYCVAAKEGDTFRTWREVSMSRGFTHWTYFNGPQPGEPYVEDE